MLLGLDWIGIKSKYPTAYNKLIMEDGEQLLIANQFAEPVEYLDDETEWCDRDLYDFFDKYNRRISIDWNGVAFRADIQGWHSTKPFDTRGEIEDFCFHKCFELLEADFLAPSV